MWFLLLLLPALVPIRPGVEAAAVLHQWDDRRAAAWAAADPAALRVLYVPGSAAGRADVRLLRQWDARGLRVVGIEMQLLRVDVRRSSPARLDLVVTDRLTGAVAFGPGVRTELPRGPVTTRRLVLVRASGEWRLAQARAVRTISPTVRSRNE